MQQKHYWLQKSVQSCFPCCLQFCVLQQLEHETIEVFFLKAVSLLTCDGVKQQQSQRSDGPLRCCSALSVLYINTDVTLKYGELTLSLSHTPTLAAVVCDLCPRCLTFADDLYCLTPKMSAAQWVHKSGAKLCHPAPAAQAVLAY